eukprot:gene3131-13143_t
MSGVIDHLQESRQWTETMEGTTLEMLVDGNIPPGAGLSSSSALVCASFAAILTALAGAEVIQSTPRTLIASLAAQCERYVGTEGGGMDHAISITARAGYAKFVTFNPLMTEDVIIPKGAVFMVSNSLTPSNKAEMASSQFNVRVLECRLAAAVLARLAGIISGHATPQQPQEASGTPFPGEPPSTNLAWATLGDVLVELKATGQLLSTRQRPDLQELEAASQLSPTQQSTDLEELPEEVAARPVEELRATSQLSPTRHITDLEELPEEVAARPVEELRATSQLPPTRQITDLEELPEEVAARLVEEVMHEGPYTREEIEQLLGHSLEELLGSWPALLAALPSVVGCGGFYLRERSMHVFQEAARVLRFKQLCEESSLADENKGAALGELMNASHASCTKLYKCSCPELDELAQTCQASGAVGSRLTGVADDGFEVRG